MAEFKNPNQQGGGQDNTSFLLMMFVLLAVLFGYQVYRAKTNPQTASPSSPNAAQQAQPNQAQPAPAAAVNASAPASMSASTTSSKSAAPAVQATAESTTVVENELYKIEFSNKGGEVRSWVLKRFTDNEGQPLDLVHFTAAEQFGYPLSLNTSDNNLNARLAQALYIPSATGTVQAPSTLSFTYSDASVKVTKTFSFDPTYVIHADVQVTQNGQPVRAALSWPAGFGDQETANAYNMSQIDTLGGGKTDHIAIKKVGGDSVVNGPFDWAGVSDPYFAAIFMPDQPDAAALTTFHHQIDIAKVKRKDGKAVATQASAQMPVLGAAIAGPAGHTATRLYVGPKQMDVLKNLQTSSGQGLEHVINFGFWGFIGQYLFVALQFIHGHFAPNWGWAIILLTVIINIVILPTRIMATRSALKMQRIQPQVNAIKAKYKNPKPTDPKSADMNAEIMKLQKDNGVNMFGGCLPSLLPIPLLFAFYTMLTSVVELRHAHWYFLHDLTLPDSTHILPILMVISMFLVQYYTPSPSVDPAQQKMMAFTMPLVSGFFTWNYASGLALYWAVGNIISIITQLAMNRTGTGREMRELAQKRARRSSGKGNTIQGKR